MGTIKLKRIYDKPERSDGFRILVDKLWPRGISKDNAKLDLWLKEIAPSNELRKWFGHDPAKWTEFQSRYKSEIEKNELPLKQLLEIAGKRKIVTLLYAAKDDKHNNALVIKNLIEKK
ncbi:MAG: DUF488 domain-containing protein [Ignavibacteriaceae bacterium]|jgi:uncharacterized protein YeaO (DUF488 family)|nr:MAG: DUF488 domain-containing protein [Chlorobiota bacterium]KXK04681.1 MAG: hypothetical protein UZ04_CHB001001058 [Chlorobi bacterium OLB4]MBV6399456.1 hypothetical protein [Ignavibacteria bacterium]MCC6886700.1 DUF488 domain-containing protein [Ignavibacteriales bacterium]MCE7953161.1 DUF488 domain-containing protein [Chlorobi bacterium CHB7]MEB2329056.1 DUF488 domain-containing protein [Ignavibacteriaceae bacterium]OQY76591.1 MAG: MarR family transcriptional regulator [Ignavibacteriale